MKQCYILLIAIISLSCDDPMEATTPREIEIIDERNEPIKAQSVTLTIGGTNYNVIENIEIDDNNILIINTLDASTTNQSEIIENLLINELNYDLNKKVILSSSGYADGTVKRRDYGVALPIDGVSIIDFKLENFTSNKIEFTLNFNLNFPRQLSENGNLTIEY